MADEMDVDEPRRSLAEPLILSDSEDDRSPPAPQRPLHPPVDVVSLSSDSETSSSSSPSDINGEEVGDSDLDDSPFQAGASDAQPVLGAPGGLVRACRKSAAGAATPGGAAGGSRPKVRLTKVTAETAAAAVQGRRSAKEKQSETQGQASGKDYEEKTKSKRRDPELRDLTFPFTVALRLEELRLSLQHLPARPFLKLSIVFRDADQNKFTADASCSSTSAIPLPFQSASDVAVLTATDLSTPTRTFSISRLPPPPTNPYHTPAQQRLAATRPDLAEILLRVSISDGRPDAAEYVGHVSLSSGKQLKRFGDGIAKLKLHTADAPLFGVGSSAPAKARKVPEAVVAQVAVSWKIKPQKKRRSEEEQRAARDTVTDGEMRVILEDELRRLEEEWRLEAVEREEYYNRLESSARPPAPVQLDPAPSAPPPSSLFHGLDEDFNPVSEATSPPSYRFAPTPRYTYISPHPRALPHDEGALKTYPFIADATKDRLEPEDSEYDSDEVVDEDTYRMRTWEDAPWANDKLRRRAKLLLRYDLSDEEAPVIKEEEEEAMQKKYLEFEALHAPDPGRVIRDFHALRALLASLGYTPSELKRLESAAVEKGKDEGKHEDDIRTFALQKFGKEDDVLVRALRVFEERTEVPAWLAQQRSNIPQPCEFCGLLFCGVHGHDDAGIAAYNMLTKQPTPKVAKEQDSCSQCGSSTCPNYVRGPPTESLDAEQEAALLAALTEPGAPSLDPCTAALILGRPVEENELFRNSPPPASASSQDLKKRRRKYAEKAKFPPTKSNGYEPCLCPGGKCGATATCSCAANKTWCDRFCGCPPTCSRRFPGCTDSHCSPDPEDCFCARHNRECDPQLCECSSGCGNSHIRLGLVKRVQVVKSTIKNAGLGLVILETAKESELIGVYGGEAFKQFYDEDQPAGAAWQTALSDTVLASYCFNSGERVVEGVVHHDHVIDSQLFGSSMRFINGTDKNGANCEPKVVYVAGTHQIAVYAKRNLRAGEELKMDYGETYGKRYSGSAPTKDEEACVA
ncbi:hypothetical protein JCM6882_005963 [Rhodosporidiobolus microsporus]